MPLGLTLPRPRSAVALTVACGAFLSVAPAALAARPDGSDFSCRASAVRSVVTNPIQATLEPTVANAGDAPCVADQAQILQQTTIGPVTVDAAQATTAQTPPDLGVPAVDGDNATATTSVTNPAVGVTGVALTADVVNATAAYTCTAGQAVASGASQVTNLVVNGQAVAVPNNTQPFTLDLGALGSLSLNQQTTAAGRITQSALVLTTPAATVTIAEATADITGNPCAAVAVAAPGPKPQCSDGGDNDGDGKTDANDPGCLSGPGGTYNPNDNDETDPAAKAQCADGVDNDGDGKVDANDPGCLSGPGGTYNPNDNDETDPAAGAKPQCSDGVDNDGDGKVDANDPGCLSGPGGTYNPNDNDETDPAAGAKKAQCADGKDNDGDGKIDAKDPGCLSGPGGTYNPKDDSEATAAGSARIATLFSPIAQRGLKGACVRGSFSTVVRGTSIRRVVFSLDGKSIGSDSTAAFTKRISTARAGVHRVSARVFYSTDSASKAVTRRFSFRRCAARVRFTG